LADTKGEFENLEEAFKALDTFLSTIILPSLAGGQPNGHQRALRVATGPLNPFNRMET